MDFRQTYGGVILFRFPGSIGTLCWDFSFAASQGKRSEEYEAHEHADQALQGHHAHDSGTKWRSKWLEGITRLRLYFWFPAL